jgi:hypothetical protein
MSFEAEKFVYGHMYKCGGNFIKYVSRKLRLIIKYKDSDEGFHSPTYLFNEELPILISIRHPYTWYISYYNFEGYEKFKNFDDWFDMVIDNGMTLNQTYHNMLGCCRSEDYFIKLDSIREDYIKFLHTIGYELSIRDIDIIKRSRKINASINIKDIELNNNQKQKVRQVDAEIFKRYSFIS